MNDEDICEHGKRIKQLEVFEDTRDKDSVVR